MKRLNLPTPTARQVGVARNVLELAGLVLLALGAGMVYPPAFWIVLGLAIVVWVNLA